MIHRASVTWDDQKPRTTRLVAAVLGLALTVPLASAPESESVRVIIRGASGAMAEASEAVLRLGGELLESLPIIDGLIAEIPSTRLEQLEGQPGVASVAVDRRVSLTANDYAEVKGHKGSLHSIAETTGASEYWRRGFTGEGVDVALIDSGVAPVEGLDGRGKVVNGPDLSLDTLSESLRHLDAYGHGSHMAGIIGGRDADVRISRVEASDSFVGIAPGSRIVNVKVADATGAADVSQVIAALDWIVKNRRAGDLNIRVVNLSFGTDSDQDPVLDPLSHAVDVAWRAGIAVIVAAGNNGSKLGRLNSPATNPRIIAVGAADLRSSSKKRKEYEVPDWSSRGTGDRDPDLVAPGKSVISLRVIDSFIDHLAQGGRIGARFFKGSGTSQAAAVMSGLAALVIEQRPDITPDQLKALLVETASSSGSDDGKKARGAGMVDLAAAFKAKTPSTRSSEQSVALAVGRGTLGQARGTFRAKLGGRYVKAARKLVAALTDSQNDEDGVVSTGVSSDLSAAGASWSGASWSGASWSGASWSGASWSGASWSGASWSGASWSGASWSGASWSGASWSGASWSAAGWD